LDRRSFSDKTEGDNDAVACSLRLKETHDNALNKCVSHQVTPPTITEAHPPMALDELVARINGFPKLTLSEKQLFIDKLVSIHPTLNLHWGPGWRFRRARPLRSEQIPETVGDVIWRNGVPARIGRANAEGSAVMYLADRRDTALREARVDRSWVVVAEFEIRPEHAIFIAPIGEFLQIGRTGRGFLSGNASDGISSMLNASPNREARSLIITDAFLYEQMVGHDDYELSSYLSGVIFKKLSQVSAIAYTSRRQLGAINLAVKTETFWDDWGLRSARRAYAKHLALGFYELSQVIGVTGVYESGKFQWEEQSSDEEAVHLLNPPYVPGST
jgi:hypothetical protein